MTTNAQHLTGLAVSRHSDARRPLRDGLCPGLRLNALKPAGQGPQRKSWIYRYRSRNGRLRQIKLGEYPTMSLSEARKAWRLQKNVRDDPNHGDPRKRLEEVNALSRAEAKAAKQRRYLIEDLCNDYLKEHIEVRRANTREPRRLLEREVIPRLGQMAAISVKSADVHRFVQAIVRRKAPRVAQMARAELKAAFEHASRAGRLPDDHPNPCERVKAPPYVRRIRAFSELELGKFLRWLPTAKVSRTVHDVMLLEILISARQGEIVAMRWGDVDLMQGVWAQPTSKNGQRHEVMLSR